MTLSVDKSHLRILLLANRSMRDPFAGGGDIYLHMLADRLSDIGHSVTYVCRRYGRHSLSNDNGRPTVITLGRRLFALRVILWYLRKGRSRFDVIVEQVFGGFRFPFMVTLFAREPLVAVWYQRHTRLFFAQFPYPIALMLSFLEYAVALFYRETAIVTLSEDAKSELIRLGIPAEHISVVPPGPSLPELDFEEGSDERQERPPLLIALGKIRRYKCFHHAFLAMNRISSTHSDVKLIIAGKREDPNYEHLLENLAERLPIQQNVEIRLNISEREKQEWLKEARALIVPSPVEGFGMVVLEANVFGTPVIASSGIPRDAVREGYNGLRYPFGNIEMLSLCMERLLSDNDLWRMLSRGAIEHSKKFNWEHTTSAFYRLLLQTIRDHKR